MSIKVTNEGAGCVNFTNSIVSLAQSFSDLWAFLSIHGNAGDIAPMTTNWESAGPLAFSVYLKQTKGSSILFKEHD